MPGPSSVSPHATKISARKLLSPAAANPMLGRGALEPLLGLPALAPIIDVDLQ